MGYSDSAIAFAVRRYNCSSVESAIELLSSKTFNDSQEVTTT
jgi:hypothetical protein